MTALLEAMRASPLPVELFLVLALVALASATGIAVKVPGSRGALVAVQFTFGALMAVVATIALV